jgi:hypothetical protein
VFGMIYHWKPRWFSPLEKMGFGEVIFTPAALACLS